MRPVGRRETYHIQGTKPEAAQESSKSEGKGKGVRGTLVRDVPKGGGF